MTCNFSFPPSCVRADTFTYHLSRSRAYTAPFLVCLFSMQIFSKGDLHTRCGVFSRWNRVFTPSAKTSAWNGRNILAPSDDKLPRESYLRVRANREIKGSNATLSAMLQSLADPYMSTQAARFAREKNLAETRRRRKGEITRPMLRWRVIRALKSKKRKCHFKHSQCNCKQRTKTFVRVIVSLRWQVIDRLGKKCLQFTFPFIRNCRIPGPWPLSPVSIFIRSVALTLSLPHSQIPNRSSDLSPKNNFFLDTKWTVVMPVISG